MLPRFIANVESVIKSWIFQEEKEEVDQPSVSTNETPNLATTTRTTTLSYDENEYEVTLFRNKPKLNKKHIQANIIDRRHPQCKVLQNFKTDFPTKAHLLQRWFGVDEFILVTVFGSPHKEMSSSESIFLLSSFSIAMKNIFGNNYPTIPLFVSLSTKWKNVYIGQMTSGKYHYRFDTDLLNATPITFYNNTGIVEYFENNLGSYGGEISVSARFTYIISNPIEQNEMQMQFQNEKMGKNNEDEQVNTFQMRNSDCFPPIISYLGSFHQSTRIFEGK